VIEICEGFVILRVLACQAADQGNLDFARITPLVSMEDLYANLMGKTYV
jgi:hypothetical protein